MFIQVSRPKVISREETQDGQEGPVFTAARSAYRTFSRRHPRWSASMFDWYFLNSYLRSRQDGQAEFEAASLTKAYLAQLKTGVPHRPEYVEELRQAVADFIEMYREAAAQP